MASERLKYRSTDAESYNIGIICALAIEATAVRSSFDRIFEWKKQQPEIVRDPNVYTFGVMGGFYVVLACIEEAGNIPATNAASHMERSFNRIELCLLVGICAIVPTSGDKQLILGDVVLSDGVFHYTHGHMHPTGHLPDSSTSKAHFSLSRQLGHLGSAHTRPRFRELVHRNLQNLMKDKYIIQEGYTYPGRTHDVLYDPKYWHKHRKEYCADCLGSNFCKLANKASCNELGCSGKITINRGRIPIEDGTEGCIDTASNDLGSSAWQLDAAYVPEIHVGTVASGGLVLRDSEIRDIIAQKHDVMAFEMEGAGVWYTTRAVVIKAGCDYADSHKNKLWQHWASMTAASCARAFLCEIQMGIDRTAKHMVQDTTVAAVPTHNELNTLDLVDQYIKGILNQLRGHHIEGTTLLTASEARHLVVQAGDLDQTTPRRRVTVYLISAQRQMQHIGARGRGQESDYEYLDSIKRYVREASACAGDSEFERDRLALYELFVSILETRSRTGFAVLDKNSQDRFGRMLDIQRTVFKYYLTGNTALLAKEYQREINGMERVLSC